MANSQAISRATEPCIPCDKRSVTVDRLRKARSAAPIPPRSLPDKDFRRKSAVMIRHITMDDRARMPWRFYGAARAVLARACPASV